MDSFSKLVSDLLSWQWWITVVVVGLLVNLASAYLKGPIDRWYGRYSRSKHAKTESERTALEKKAEQLANEPSLLLLEAISELRAPLIANVKF